MKLPIRLLPEAKEEFEAAVDWYKQQNVAVSKDFIARVREVFKRI